MAKNLLVAVRQRKENAMKHVPGLLLSLGIAWAPGVLQAQDAWPARPITFVVPYGAGGYTDLVGRLTARYVEKALGKPVIVDNRAGSSGAGGLTHYSVELFQARSGIKVVHIPFKSGGPSTAAVVSGEVDFAFANMTEGLPQVKGGTVRGLAVTSLKRSPYLPDLPTVNEALLPDFVVETWNGIMAPSKAPEPIIRKVSEILIKMADDPEVKEI